MRAPASPEQLFAFLEELGIRHDTLVHPPLFTVAQSRQLRGSIAGAHTKNLLLGDKRGAVFLLSALEDALIDLKRLHLRLGSGRLSFVSAERMRDLIGIEPGAVTPFAAINDPTQRIRIVLDADMMRAPLLNFHPLVNTMSTALAAQDLLKFLRATGHTPAVIALAGPAPPAASGPGEPAGHP